MSKAQEGPDFLAGGGEMGALVRAFDWSSTPIGAPETWPQSLRVTVRLVLNSGHPMFIWWGPDLIQFYNDAYRKTMGPERHPSALGARGRECWAEIWDIIGPQIDYVMAGKGSTWNVDHFVPVTRHGRREDVWWTYSYGPIDVDGKVGGVLVICNDVTSEHLAKEALKDQMLRFERLFEHAPGFMALLRGPDHLFELANAACKTLVGRQDVTGRRAREIVPPLDGQEFLGRLDEVYRTGRPIVGKRVPLYLQASPNDPAKKLYIDFVIAPILEANNESAGVFVEGVDVTDHVYAEHRLRLVNDELKHRLKNTLAVLSAIAAQTFRNDPTRDSLEKYQGRIAAFGRAHDLLTAANWAEAPLDEVIDVVLAPYKTDARRFAISGPTTIVNSRLALSLALAMHELATNAIKYGALSGADGHVVITWRHDGGEEDPLFIFTWQEVGGPPVAPPSNTGFGSRLLSHVLAEDFGGRVEVSYPPSGLTCRLTAPARNLEAQSE
jgi:two-component sensor histidine kinase